MLNSRENFYFFCPLTMQNSGWINRSLRDCVRKIICCDRMKSIISWSTRSKLNALVLLMESAQPVIRSFGAVVWMFPIDSWIANCHAWRKWYWREIEKCRCYFHQWKVCSVGWTRMVSWRHQESTLNVGVISRLWKRTMDILKKLSLVFIRAMRMA